MHKDGASNIREYSQPFHNFGMITSMQGNFKLTTGQDQCLKTLKAPTTLIKLGIEDFGSSWILFKKNYDIMLPWSNYKRNSKLNWHLKNCKFRVETIKPCRL